MVWCHLLFQGNYRNALKGSLTVRTFERHELLPLHYQKRSRSRYLSHPRLRSLLLGSQACRHPLRVRNPTADRCFPHGVGDPLVHVGVEGVGD
jgi:hypothetical protein